MFDKPKSLFWFMIVLGLMLAACGETGSQPVGTSEGGNISSLANPASVYCEGLGFELEMRTTVDGTSGVCIFTDGSECEEWDFLSGRCGQEHSYCVQQGNVLQENGNVAICEFSDGSSCLEIDFFEGRCGQ